MVRGNTIKSSSSRGNTLIIRKAETCISKAYVIVCERSEKSIDFIRHINC